MSLQLINHSPDIKQLRDEGYEIELKGGHLIVHHIPYVNINQEIKFGALVTTLDLISNQRTAKPNNHVIYFIGEHPCNKDGSIILPIQHSTQDQKLCEGIIVNCSFSNKPKNGYDDYHHKVTRYIDIISAPANSIDKNVTAKTFKVIADVSDDSVFQYLDTNSSRANIDCINSKFKGQKIAIIGLGGTGSYILDFIAKAPVQKIHLFDGDIFLQHNAFRSPSAISNEELNSKMQKVQYYSSLYSKMHKHIIPHDEYITDDNISLLSQMSFVFICIDRDNVRKSIIDNLVQMKISFIDVGLGVNTVDDALIGTIRVTVGTPDKNDHLVKRVPVSEKDDNEYSTNIQIADLNALNAILAVIKWKKMSGFYQDLKQEHHITYSVNNSLLLNEDTTS